MKKNISKLVFSFILVLCFYSADAQYLTGLGARVGTSMSLDIIQYYNPGSRGAMHLAIGTRNVQRGIVIAAIYEVHSKNHNINIELANVGFFMGLGCHGGFFKGKNIGGGMSAENNVTALGVDGDAGVEWKIPGVPLLLSADLKLYYEFLRGVTFGKTMSTSPLDNFDYALTLRYVFN